MERKAMKTNLVQHTYGRVSEKSRSLTGSGTRRIPTVDSPERHINWFSSYDEEWVAFVNERSIHKIRPGINNFEPEPLPRVWNCPRF